MTPVEQLLIETESHIADFFAKNVSQEYVFHDLEHTIQTVAAAKTIGEGFRLEDRSMLSLLLATWFHDTGYSQGAEGHEDRSCANATQFLQGKIPQDQLDEVIAAIRATRVPQTPDSLIGQIIGDADLSHLGMKIYWDRTSKLRQELNTTRKRLMSDQEWVDFELDFMLKHEYHTTVAQELFNKRKAKHIQQLLKQKRRLNPDAVPTEAEIAMLEGKDKAGNLRKVLKDTESEIKASRMGRGVETMYRTTYRTHTNLSSLADSKANQMISLNAIIISILASTLLPKLKSHAELAIPTIFLLTSCLTAMVFATLATRPKVTEGKVTREAIQQRKANLLFFGNFYNMSLEDFQWGVNEMLTDSEFLYSSMSKDLYYLGIVLGKKYRYLSLCYNFFMYGIIVSVIGFVVAFMTQGHFDPTVFQKEKG